MLLLLPSWTRKKVRIFSLATVSYLITTLFKLTVLTAVVSQTAYEVEEEDGAVTVCVDISGAYLARAVTITVSTQDITAIGTLVHME